MRSFVSILSSKPFAPSRSREVDTDTFPFWRRAPHPPGAARSSYHKVHVDSQGVGRKVEQDEDRGDDEEHLGDAVVRLAPLRRGGRWRKAALEPVHGVDAPGDARVQRDHGDHGHHERERRVDRVHGGRERRVPLAERAAGRAAPAPLHSGRRQQVRVQAEREGDQAANHGLGAAHRAHGGAQQRVAHGHEALDRERDHEPHAHERGHVAEEGDGLAAAGAVEHVHAHARRRRPHREQVEQEEGVGGGEGGQVPGRAVGAEGGRAEHHQAERVARRPKRHQERDRHELDAEDEGLFLRLREAGRRRRGHRFASLRSFGYRDKRNGAALQHNRT